MPTEIQTIAAQVIAAFRLENNKVLGWSPMFNDEAAAYIQNNPPAGASAGTALQYIVELFSKK